MTRQESRHIRLRTLRTHFPRRMAIVAPHDLDEIFPALDDLFGRTTLSGLPCLAPGQGDEAGRLRQNDRNREQTSAQSHSHDSLLSYVAFWLLNATFADKPRTAWFRVGWKETPPVGIGGVGRQPYLLLECSLIRDHLAGHDVHVETQRAIARSPPLEVMASGWQAKRLCGRREFTNRPDQRAIHEQLRGGWRDFEAHAAHVRLGGRLNVNGTWVNRRVGLVVRIDIGAGVVRSVER